MKFTNRFAVFALVVLVSLSVSAKDQKEHEEEMQGIATFQGYVNLMQSYYDAIITTRDISDDAEMAAVFQMQKIGDFYKESGHPENAIGVYESILAKTKNQTIRNAAYHMLSERYRELGKHKEAIEVLKKGVDENLQLIK